MTWKRTTPGGIAKDASGTAFADNAILRASGTGSAQGSGWAIDDNDDMSVGALGDQLILDADGDTVIVCDSDDVMRLETGGSFALSLANGAITGNRPLDWADNYQQMTEIADPGNPGANRARLFVKDNGAGKTQLMVIFNTGSAIELAIEA